MSGYLPPGCTQLECDMAQPGYWDEPEEEEAPEQLCWFYTVAVFLVDKAYGGSEEGGWYYDCGEPIEAPLPGLNNEDVPRIFTTEAEACGWANHLQDKLNATINKGRRPISSVLSEGMYQARVCDGYPARFPETRPHYE